MEVYQNNNMKILKFEKITISKYGNQKQKTIFKYGN